MRVRVRMDVFHRLQHRLERGSPVVRIERARERVELLAARLAAAERLRVKTCVQKVEGVAAALRAVSPQAVLERGYSITRLKDGTIVRAASQVKTGDVLKTRVAEGEVQSVVGKLKQESLF
jgi:exodeoxyribonuclease VII large subunit